MRPDYRGYSLKWGNDAKSVAKTFTKKKPYVIIQEINEIHSQS